jgi:hypothetical protein
MMLKQLDTIIALIFIIISDFCMESFIESTGGILPIQS